MGIVKELLGEYTDYFKATFARCMFLMHAIIVMWRTVILLGNTYWLLGMGIISMIAEYLVTLIVRNGQEWNWVSPATITYLVSAVPGLWLQKLYHLGHLDTVANVSLATVPSTSVTLDFSSEDWMLLSEQTMMVTIILSRWLLPKGNMTHNEVSQLLLLYLSLSSDIIDFLSLFSFEKVTADKTYCYVLLFWWTWALLQFTLVLTSTETDNNNNTTENNTSDTDSENKHDSRNINADKKVASICNSVGHRDIQNANEKDSSKTNEDKDSTTFSKQEEGGERTTESVIDIDKDENCKDKTVKVSDDSLPKALTLRQVLCSSELWAILVVLFLQDGPFLANRLVVMLYLNVFNYTIIFFICKNGLVIALQTYRMIALVSESRAKVKESKRKTKEAIKARRYSTVSLHSVFDENSDDDDDDEEDEVEDGEKSEDPHVIFDTDRRRPSEWRERTALDSGIEQSGSSTSSSHPPSFSSAFVAMPNQEKNMKSSSLHLHGYRSGTKKDVSVSFYPPGGSPKKNEDKSSPKTNEEKSSVNPRHDSKDNPPPLSPSLSKTGFADTRSGSPHPFRSSGAHTSRNDVYSSRIAPQESKLLAFDKSTVNPIANTKQGMLGKMASERSFQMNRDSSKQIIHSSAAYSTDSGSPFSVRTSFSAWLSGSSSRLKPVANDSQQQHQSATDTEQLQRLSLHPSVKEEGLPLPDSQPLQASTPSPVHNSTPPLRHMLSTFRSGNVIGATSRERHHSDPNIVSSVFPAVDLRLV